METQTKTQALGATFYGSVTFNGPMFDIHDNYHVTIVNRRSRRLRRKRRRPRRLSCPRCSAPTRRGRYTPSSVRLAWWTRSGSPWGCRMRRERCWCSSWPYDWTYKTFGRCLPHCGALLLVPCARHITAPTSNERRRYSSTK